MSGWKTALRRGKPLWISAGSGAFLLVAGLLAGHYALPARTVGVAPAAGLVTVPVSYGKLENEVTLRGQAGYADSVQLTLDAAALSGPAVVTGHLPAIGAQFDALSIALEVAGRPVIVLPGLIAGYRSLKYGMTGPDVSQFKQAMKDVGIDAGDPANPLFDETAAAAIPLLYSKVGYAAPENGEGTATAVTDARAAEQSAEDGLSSARNDLSKAAAGPSAVDIQSADNAVRSAARALAAAMAAQPNDPNQIADLQDSLALATTQRGTLSAAPDTAAAQLAVRSATRAVAQAKSALTLATQAALPTLPASEVLFVAQLPARVEKVDAKLGTVLAGSAMTVSGANLSLSGSVDSGDSKLMKVGDRATFDLGGNHHGATVTAITPGADADARPTVGLTPDPLTSDQVTQLAGQNVRVTVPVGATSGPVLSVPVAALSAGPGGETRIRVVDGDPREGAKAATRLVVVDTGLAAKGEVEVRPKDGGLRKNDLVVVSR